MPSRAAVDDSSDDADVDHDSLRLRLWPLRQRFQADH